MKSMLIGTALCLIGTAAVAHETSPPPATPAVSPPPAVTAAATATGAPVTTHAHARSRSTSSSTSQSGPVTVNNNGGGRDMPSMLAAGSVNGNHPCGLGTGVGVGWAFFQWMYAGSGCERREDAELLDALGQRPAALRSLCGNDKFVEALAVTNTPCRETAEAWQRQGYHQRADGYWIK